IAKQLAEKPPNTLPSDTIPNPREECKTIRVIEMEEIPEVQVEVPIEKSEIIAEIKNQEDVQQSSQSSSKKHTRTSSKFLEVLACLEVNIPLLKHLKDTPEYVKTMKELLQKKKTVKKGGAHQRMQCHNPEKLAHQKERSG
ncbi:hypothetical protein PIB30_105812, partial [Stylosanthes scabra]|nr:hypothetical protein [Stylosanthes scabra]